MEKLKTLNELLDMTIEAEGLASDGVDAESLRPLFGEIRRKAQRERAKLRDRSQSEAFNPTRYQLCMIGILEECELGRGPSPSLIGIEAKLSRIHAEIDRTIKEIKSSRHLM